MFLCGVALQPYKAARICRLPRRASLWWIAQPIAAGIIGGAGGWMPCISGGVPGIRLLHAGFGDGDFSGAWLQTGLAARRYPVLIDPPSRWWWWRYM